jgi:hypothetical protein
MRSALVAHRKPGKLLHWLRHTREETAGMMGVSLRTCIQRYDTAMDRLTGLFLDAGLLETKNGEGLKR